MENVSFLKRAGLYRAIAATGIAVMMQLTTQINDGALANQKAPAPLTSHQASQLSLTCCTLNLLINQMLSLSI